jgi:hypothetical protein
VIGRAIRSAAMAGAALLLAAAAPVPEVLPGTFALPGQAAKATATLTATPGTPAEAAGPGVPMTLGVTMTRVGAKQPIQRYDTELARQLHIIAVSDDLRRFVHVHGDAPDKRGRFAVPIRFPDSGFYWVYADAAPSGLGQQVFRFDLRVGAARGASAPPPAPPLPPPAFEGSDGDYAVRFAPFALTAGRPAMLRLAILHGAEPARDLAPYLGVAAHAILISARDHSYIHVHAMPDQPMQMSGHSDTAMQDMHMPRSGQASSELVLHLTPPAPGLYRLWLQFMAGGQVRTVAFTVEVK